MSKWGLAIQSTAVPSEAKPTWSQATDPAQLAKEQEERRQNGGYTLAEIDEIADDPEKWARLHAKIPDRSSKLPIPWKPSALQGRLFRHYRFHQRDQSPCHVVLVKTRRGGGSAGAQGLVHCHVHNYVAKVGVIGTTEEVSMNMFRDYARFLNEHDDFPGWKPAVKVLETGSLMWANGSTWQKYTADNPESARSASLNGYHGTEVGRWKDTPGTDSRQTLQSMFGALPKRGFTLVIEESTARGGSGAFYERFQGARWPTAEELGCEEGKEYWRKWEDETPQNIDLLGKYRQFVRVFAAWFEDDENRPEHGISAEQEAYLKATLQEKEIRLIERYKTIGPQGERLGDQVKRATLWEQIMWRRTTIDGPDFQGDIEFFEQEFPSSPAEAFASSGKHSFNRAGCAWMVETAKQRIPEIGVLERQNDGGVVFRCTDASEAWFIMWERPREGYRYLAPLDTCGGRSNVRNVNTSDYNAGLVLRDAAVDPDTRRKQPVRVVAALAPKNQMDPDVLADKMGLMSDFFGHCTVVFEVNNTGAAFRQEAKMLGLNLYREEKTDKYTSEVSEYLGWTTTKESRQQIIGTLKKHIRNNSRAETREDGVECWSPTAAQECSDMVVDDDNVDRAPGSKHDDHAMALGIGLCTLGSATHYAARRRRRQGPADRNMWRAARRA